MSLFSSAISAWAKPYQNLGNWFQKQAFGSGPQDPSAAGFDTAATDALNKSKSYSAMDALNTSVKSLYDQFGQSQTQALEKLGGTEVGAGRFGSGYALQDSQTEQFNAEQDLNDKIASEALSAEQLTQNEQNSQQQQYLDILSGNRDWATGAYNARTGARSQLFGTLAGLAGRLIPGGGGAAKAGAGG